MSVGRFALMIAAIGPAVIGAGAAGAASDNGAAVVVARIGVERNGGTRTFIAEAKSSAALSVSYRLHTTVRKSSGSKSTTNQSGNVALRPGKLQALSRTSLTIGPSDRFCVALTITSGGKVLAEDRVGAANADSSCVTPPGGP